MELEVVERLGAGVDRGQLSGTACVERLLRGWRMRLAPRGLSAICWASARGVPG